jgi:hypothetical protein
VEEVKATGHCFKLWDGRADLHEFEADGPTGHIEGLTLRLHNPETHQWSLYWANGRNGKMEMPQIGEFKNGRAEFYAQAMLNGKVIFIRFDWINAVAPFVWTGFSVFKWKNCSASRRRGRWECENRLHRFSRSCGKVGKQFYRFPSFP